MVIRLLQMSLFCVQTSMSTHVTHNIRGKWDPARRRDLFLITRTRTRVLLVQLLLASKGTRQLQSDGAYGRDREQKSESRTGTTTRVGGGRYEKILGGLLQGGCIANKAPPWPGGTFADRQPQPPPREGLGTNKTRFGESE